MLSRVADSIYWMSRYIERAENVARFIDVNSGIESAPGVKDPAKLTSLIAAVHKSASA